MTVTLEIPEATYRALVELADQRGQSPEMLLQSTIAAMTDDPLEKWIGAFDSGVPDWPNHHDEYLGQSAAAPHDPSTPQP